MISFNRLRKLKMVKQTLPPNFNHLKCLYLQMYTDFRGEKKSNKRLFKASFYINSWTFTPPSTCDDDGGGAPGGAWPGRSSQGRGARELASVLCP